jgi:hypothetical protein
MKKTAAEKQGKKSVEKKPEFVRVASLNEIPSDFIRLGTGFYRKGHHLWELAASEDGYTLTRKHGEDHVLGYDPEPVIVSKDVTDRFGSTLKVGSKVKLPFRGKVATGTIVILQPGASTVEMEQGGRLDSPPDMLELLEQLVGGEPQGPEHMETGPAMEGFVEEETAEEEHGGEGDVEAAGSEFQPSVEPSSKAAPAVLASKFNEDLKKLASDLDTINHQHPDLTGVNPIAFADLDLKTWRQYWASVGARVAQSDFKPKEEKMTEEQKRQKRKQRAEERKRERAGTPPGTPHPPKAKTAADEDNGLAKCKEKLRLHEQFFDAVVFILGDEKLREDEVLLADELEREIESLQAQSEEMEEGSELEMEEELDIEKPPKKDMLEVEPGRSIISMSQLKKKTPEQRH